MMSNVGRWWMKGKQKDIVGINSEYKGRKTENGPFVKDRVLQFVGVCGILKKKHGNLFGMVDSDQLLTYEQMSGEAGKLFFEETEVQKDCAKPSRMIRLLLQGDESHRSGKNRLGTGTEWWPENHLGAKCSKRERDKMHSHSSESNS